MTRRTTMPLVLAFGLATGCGDSDPANPDAAPPVTLTLGFVANPPIVDQG